MGVIKDGSVSGVLPNNSNRAFAINYPGYPASVERAVETLGGNEGILKVRTNKSNKLELHFRPEDPYSHPAFGGHISCKNFLLKISKKKVKDVHHDSIYEHVIADSHRQNSSFSRLTEASAQNIQSDFETLSASPEVEARMQNGAQDQLSADIAAQVSEAYHFTGMVDYQHVLAVHADVAQRTKRKWVEGEPLLEKCGRMDVDQEDLMIFVPPLFTNDDPNQLGLSTKKDVSMRKKPERVFQLHSEIEMEPCLAIDFSIKDILLIPKKVDWEKSIPKNSDQWKWLMVLHELFNERPIWVKKSLTERLLDRGQNMENSMLKRLLYIASYYFSNGPFLKLRIRKGYDPRKDPESRIYQKTDFRVPPSLRSYCDTNMASGLTNKWKDICAFRVFPYNLQSTFQLCDLEDDYIQQEIRKPGSQESCHLVTGWFSSHAIRSFRYRVAQRFLSVYPEAGAETFLKTAIKNFEKSKRIHISVKVDEQKQANKGVLESEDKEPNDEVEYEEDEEDDNREEDMDADETSDLVDGVTNFPLPPGSYTNHENVSKDYLQELFGSFPYRAGGGDEMQAADPLDGGYEIFEQFSDDNYSDDDDEDY
ncbi:hypothetical protein ACJIZ3_006480 [Penstemon smallii]|uniref:Uncharacterized protein n=1 Tax=Penstemon smallii TaxID=265156 RepID=A0ABD3S7T5_9LAMI